MAHPTEDEERAVVERTIREIMDACGESPEALKGAMMATLLFGAGVTAHLMLIEDVDTARDVAFRYGQSVFAALGFLLPADAAAEGAIRAIGAMTRTVKP